MRVNAKNRRMQIDDTVVHVETETTGVIRGFGPARVDGDVLVRVDGVDPHTRESLQHFHYEELRVISTREIDSAERLLLANGWTLTPPLDA